jgi:hypothetical protein
VWRYRLAVWIAVWTLQSGVAFAQIVAIPTAISGFTDNTALRAMKQAITGAASRLGRAECAAVLADFGNESGQDLQTLLASSGKTLSDAFGLLRFIENGQEAQCRAPAVLAFTQRGSRLIRICGRQFKNGFSRDPRATEMIVIHEFLHSLGLGENPPTSAAITAQVTLRCGFDLSR